MKWDVRLRISLDVARGLHFLHSAYLHPVIHRDVKSSNVLLSARFEAKLSDFGLAVVSEEDDEMALRPAVGTRPYMPPEAFQRVVTPKVDVYGFGMIVYELATGLPPYSSKKKLDLKSYVDDIEQQGIDLRKMLDPKAHWPKGKPHQPSSYGLDFLQIAKRCTVKEHPKRVVIAEVRCNVLAIHPLVLTDSSQILPNLEQLTKQLI